MVIYVYASALKLCLITARKRSLRRLCFYTCLSFCPHWRGWYPSMYCRWHPSMPCSMSQGSGIRACLAGFQSHTQGEVEGSGQGGLQANIQGVSRPTPKGGVSRPTPRGSPGPHLGGCVSQHALRQTPPDGYCCRRYTSYWNAFLLNAVLFRI